MAGTLFVVATPIGNLEDISARALRVLREVAVIAAEDTRHTGHLLQRFGLTTRTTSFHEHSEKGKAAELIARLQAGDDVALVSDAGTPTVSDPGVHLVRMAHEAGVRVEPVPGPSAAIAALSASGFDSDGFLFLGFPPTKQKDRQAWFGRIDAARQLTGAVVFYESPHRVDATLRELADRLGDPEVFVARELTKAHEELRFGRLSTIRLASGKGEFTVVVNLGSVTESDRSTDPPGPADVLAEFSHLTKIGGLNRRQAISALSQRHSLPARQVFALLEQAKNSAV